MPYPRTRTWRPPNSSLSRPLIRWDRKRMAVTPLLGTDETERAPQPSMYTPQRLLHFDQAATVHVDPIRLVLASMMQCAQIAMES